MWFKNMVTKFAQGSLVKQIFIGLVLGILLAVVAPDVAKAMEILGTFFVGSLKAVAPILVLVLVANAIAQHQSGNQVYIKPILTLYLL